MSYFFSKVPFFLFVFVFIELYSVKSFTKEKTTNSILNKSIETQNFKIIYNENSSEVAEILAKNIENWGNEVYIFLGQKPKFKITVFISNDIDLANAFSAFTIISLYLNNNSYIYNQFGNNWLENTFKHELAHNVTRIYDYGFWGGLVFSNFREIFIPNWIHEGSSVLVESKVSKEGRMNNPTFWAPERFLVNNNLNYYFYYRGSDHYLNGSSFLNFYYTRYGKEKTIKSYGDYSSRPITTLLNSPITYFAKNVSKSNDDLLVEWQASLKYKYKDVNVNHIEGNEIELMNYNISDLLGEDIDKNLVFHAYKKNILTNKYENYIVKINNQGKIVNQKRIDLGVNSSTYNRVDDSISFTKGSVNNITGSFYNNAYSTKTSTFSGVEKIDNSLRSYRVVKDKNGCYYRLVVNNEKTALLDCNNNELIPFSANQSMEHLKYDMDNNILYLVAGKLDETKKYIYKYDISNKKLTKIIEGLDPYIKGNKLYFSYAKSPNGVFNIYQYNLDTKQVKQVTDTKYGAFQPTVIDNTLYYLSYSTDKNNFVISSIFHLKLGADAKNVNMYNSYEIDKPYDNGYKSDYVILDNELERKEEDNNYYSLIFEPLDFFSLSVGSEASLKLDFLLGTGKHNLSFGLSEASPFISFSKSNFITLGSLNSDPFYTISFYGKKEGSNNIGMFNFNPILYNGYGYLPTLVLNTYANTLGGGALGGSLKGDYTSFYYMFKKPKTEDTRSFGYSELGASYSIFSATMIQVDGDGEILYSTNPFNLDSEHYIWKDFNINNLYMATMNIPFTMYIYKGMKTGYLGYNDLTISPKASFIYTNDSMQNYTKGTVVGLTFSNNIRILQNIDIKLDFTLYSSQQETIKGKTNNKGLFFSLEV